MSFDEVFVYVLLRTLKEIEASMEFTFVTLAREELLLFPDVLLAPENLSDAAPISELRHSKYGEECEPFAADTLVLLALEKIGVSTELNVSQLVCAITGTSVYS